LVFRLCFSIIKIVWHFAVLLYARKEIMQAGERFFTWRPSWKPLINGSILYNRGKWIDGAALHEKTATETISWEDSYWSSLIIAKQTINSSNSLIWLEPDCEQPKADRMRAGWKQRWRRICQIFGLDSPKWAYQPKKCKTLEIVEPMKKRCIDSAFKVIKVPKRPGQLVNEGRRKKGMMENHTATPKPRQQRRRSKWKEPWRFYLSIFYFKIY